MKPLFAGFNDRDKLNRFVDYCRGMGVEVKVSGWCVTAYPQTNVEVASLQWWPIMVPAEEDER